MQTATKIFLDALRAANSNAGTLKVFVDAFFTRQEDLALLGEGKKNIVDVYSAGTYDGCVEDALLSTREMFIISIKRSIKDSNLRLLGGVIKPNKHNMDTFIERLLNEETELNEKKAKLQSFVESESFKGIDKEQQALLKIQLNSMQTYSECLNQRLIQINNKPTEEN